MNRLLLALVAGSCLVSVARAKEPVQTTSAAMTKAAQEYVAALNAEESAKGVLEFDNPARLDWHNIPKPQRKGFQVRDMSEQQRELCHNLLRASLSKTGYEKAVAVMSLENNLFEGEKGLTGAPQRDPVRYFLTIFGKPAMQGNWGYSFEGHHLSLNFVVSDGVVVCDTPSFWGANPSIVKVYVPGGPEVGVRTLRDEEFLAFDLIKSLDDAQRKQAIIAEKAPAEYRAGGQPQAPQTLPEGIAASKLTDAQKKTLWSLLEVYNGHLTDDVAAENLAEIKSAGLDRVHFAWAGATELGVGHYYRVQGPTFVLELVNVQADPQGNPANHIHSVYRSLKGDFAISVKPAE